MIPTVIHGETFYLHPSGAAFWPSHGMLLVADVHLGKVSHFRKAGIAVPILSMLANYEKLERVVTDVVPMTICFMGDLFHSHFNREWEFFAWWAESQSARIVLVAGNHDVIDKKMYELLGISVVPELNIGKFRLTHHPEDGVGFNICGHVHPCVCIRGKGKQKLRLPCFYQTGSQMILPAFGTFTGMYELSTDDADAVFVLAGNEVLRIS